MTTKICHHCNRQKPAAEFHRDNSRPDGLRYICKDCEKASRKVCDMDCFHCLLPDCINNDNILTEWEKK